MFKGSWTSCVEGDEAADQSYATHVHCSKHIIDDIAFKNACNIICMCRNEDNVKTYIYGTILIRVRSETMFK